MFNVCIKCGAADKLQLALEDCETLTCSGGCDETFTVADIEDHIKGLKKLIMVCKAAKAAAEKE